MDDVLGIRFDESLSPKDRLSTADLLEIGPPDARFEVPDEKFTVFPLTATRDGRRLSRAMASASASASVTRVAPVYSLGTARAILTDRLVVGIRDDRGEQALASSGIDVVERFAGGVLGRVPEGLDPERVLDELARQPHVSFVEPDLLVVDRPPRLPGGVTSSDVSAPASGIGYAATITRLEGARALARGRGDVVIAVLDDAVQASHPDLRTVVVDGYDAVRDVEGIPPDDTGEHGTACAGLAAANGGVRGFGSGCSVMSVRVGQSSAADGPWVTATSYLRRGIDWASARASVLSLSWGGSVPSTAVDEAIARSRGSGRGGRGCVVVAAAGNVPGPVDFPAALPGVLAVSGTNSADEFKTPTSSDGETWWGSASGPQVDLAAPSVGVRTTGLSGRAGSTPDDYVRRFNGTSAATPMVAGAAAILLGLLPGASEREIRDLLTAHAAKVGTRPYTSGRNDCLGSGRLDVLASVRAVLGRPPGRAGDPSVPPNEVRLPVPTGSGAPAATSGDVARIPPGEVRLGPAPGASDDRDSRGPAYEVHLADYTAGGTGSGPSVGDGPDRVPPGEVRLPVRF